MATSKSLRILALAISISAAAACQAWGWAKYRDIPGTGLGGKNVYDLQACKQHCVNQPGCRAAQFCGPQGTCGFPRSRGWGSEMYNCYIYASQSDTAGQLREPVSTGSFLLYFYNPDCYRPDGGGGSGSGSWSGEHRWDIQGTGLGGTYESSLWKCKERCVGTQNCQSAQYGGLNCNYPGNCYQNNCRAGFFSPYGSNQCNCFIYSRQNANFPVASAIRNFKMYYYYRNGNQNGWDNGPSWPWRRLANTTAADVANTTDVIAV